MKDVQKLLAAIAAVLPLLPGPARAGEILDLAARALEAGETLDGLRREIEAMAARGSADDLDAALARVREASARFRASL
ncbi:MAG: hypothetical protein JNJ73_06035 [Hyphomonadaceae bacterium]|nr:hypothetical protein [Hyphomonadaceae bacterium]